MRPSARTFIWSRNLIQCSTFWRGMPVPRRPWLVVWGGIVGIDIPFVPPDLHCIHSFQRRQMTRPCSVSASQRPQRAHRHDRATRRLNRIRTKPAQLGDDHQRRGGDALVRSSTSGAGIPATSVASIVQDGDRVRDVMSYIGTLIKKAPPRRDLADPRGD